MRAPHQTGGAESSGLSGEASPPPKAYRYQAALWRKPRETQTELPKIASAKA